MRKNFLTALFFLTILLVITACGGNNNEANNDNPGSGTAQTGGSQPPATSNVITGSSVGGPRTASGFQPLSTLPADAVGEVTVLTGGNAGLFMDVGNNPPVLAHNNWFAVLRYIRAAQEFNKIYPNIRINVMSVDFFKDNDSEIPFSQGLLNVQAQWGMLPDMWETHDLILHILQGEVSDLSRFSNEASYQAFNPGLMNMMNFYGGQFGLPGWFSTWSVVINMDLADELNIDIPPFNWNYNQYVNFISQADMVNQVGDIWTAGFFLELGARDVAWSANHYGRVNFDTPEVRRLLDLEHRVHQYTLWSQWQSPNVMAMLDNASWWDQQVFANNQMLANNFGGWMFSEFSTPGHTLYMPGRWDMWPMPGSMEMGPSVTTVFDPLVIRNFANDPNPDHQLAITYAFASFLYGSLEGMIARNPGGAEIIDEHGNPFFQVTTSSSWPLVRSPYLLDHMEVWYAGGREQFRTMAGFQNLLRLYEDGQFWGRDARTFPNVYVEDGVIRNVFDEWYNRGEADVVGVSVNDPAWPDRVKARLAEWTELSNHRLNLANQSIRDALTRFYNITNF
jgi:ABC-type glycerol-3-phosphate transport system substrate-binding protein